MIFKMPEIGSKKTVVKFCIFPVFFDDRIYWLEKVTVEYERRQVQKKYSYSYKEKWVIERITTASTLH